MEAEPNRRIVLELQVEIDPHDSETVQIPVAHIAVEREGIAHLMAFVGQPGPDPMGMIVAMLREVLTRLPTPQPPASTEPSPTGNEEQAP